MHGVSPKVPLINLSEDASYGLNKTIPDAVSQNLRNLLLTTPGEKMMDPDFGVGLWRYLFEPNLQATHSEIEGRIRAQVQKYLPFISIHDISFIKGKPTDPTNDNALTIKLKYLIEPITVIDILVINSDLMG